jgi:hypothetical protein
MKDMIFKRQMRRNYPYVKDSEPEDERKTLADYIEGKKRTEVKK